MVCIRAVIEVPLKVPVKISLLIERESIHGSYGDLEK
jgi:hypothetical protein